MQKSLFEQFGGEEPIRRLVESFYSHMDRLPEAADVRAMHPADLSIAIQKLYEFFVGWSGGPPLYIEKYGHPRLRRRHMPFPIGEKERDQWMLCMRKALDDTEIEEGLREKFDAQVYSIADFMRNIELPSSDT